MNARSRRRTVAVTLAGSVALASGAYAIGSQSGGGTSGAATSEGFRTVRAIGPGPDEGAASLASRLGVSEARLRAAFDALRGRAPLGGDPRARFEKALADALGLPQSRVTAALDKLRAQHEAGDAARRDAFAKTLANALGLDPAKVSTALADLRPDRRGFHVEGPPPGGPPPGGPPFRRHFGLRIGPDGFPSALAAKLGVDPAKLRAALEKIGPPGPIHGPRLGGRPRNGLRGDGPRFIGPPGFADDLAKALGVKSSDLRAAFDKVRSQLESVMAAKRDAFAAELAKQLGIPVQKVKDALPAEPHGPGPGPGGGP